MKLGHSLNTAVIGNNLEIIKLILQKGGKPLNQEDVGEKHYLQFDSSTIGFTHTLHYAIARLISSQDYCKINKNREEYIKANKDKTCKIIKLLVENGAEVVNEPKYSTLHYAIETGCPKLVKLVINCRAEYVAGKRRSINSPGRKSTEELAQEIGNKDIIKLVFQQKEKDKMKCSKLVQSVIKNGTTYPLDEGRYTKRENKILDKCAVEPILDKMNDNLKITL